MSAQEKESLTLVPVSEGDDDTATTVGDEITRIIGNIADSYTAVKTKGVTILSTTPETSDNLPGAIAAIKVSEVIYDPTSRRLTITTT